MQQQKEQRHRVYELIDERWEAVPQQHVRYTPNQYNGHKLTPQQIADIQAADHAVMMYHKQREAEAAKREIYIQRGLNYGAMAFVILMFGGGAYYLIPALADGIVSGAKAAGDVVGQLLIYAAAGIALVIAVFFVWGCIDMDGGSSGGSSRSSIHHHHHYNQYNNCDNVV